MSVLQGQGDDNGRFHTEESVEPAQNDVRTLYKGRKYNWQAKVNFHIHLIQHIYLDTVEIIAFDTASFNEAPHVFVPFSVVADKVHIEVHEHVVDEVCKDFEKRGIPPPSLDAVEEMVIRNAVGAYILDRITVTTHPLFCIDVRDYEKSYRKEAGSRANEKQKAVNAEWTEGPTYSHKGTMLKPYNMNHDSLASTFLGTADLDNLGIEMASSTSIIHPKPESADLTVVQRVGDSTTEIGSVVNEKVDKLDKLLAALVQNHSSAAAPTTSKNIMNKISILNKQHKSRNKKTNFGFHKFKSDHALLVESLSYIHVSDFLSLQRVCKLWRDVLSEAVCSANHLVISSRDHHLSEMSRLQAFGGARVGYMVRPMSIPDTSDDDGAVSDEEVGFEKQQKSALRRAQALDSRLQWRSVFVLSQTVEMLLHMTVVENLHTLKLHYVVLNDDLIDHLSVLSGHLKHLSLGIIKFDDSPVEELEPPSPAHDVALPVPHPPGQDHRPSPVAHHEHGHRVLSHKTGRGILHSARSHHPHHSSHSYKNGEDEEEEQTLQLYVVRPHNPIAYLRYMRGDDVARILQACGAELTQLELSVTIGPLPPDVFLHCPKLVTLSATDTVLAGQVQTHRQCFAGPVELSAFVSAMQGITIPSLLSLMSDALHEALLITDKQGRICIANPAWERLTGYPTAQVSGQHINFLRGELTDPKEFDRIDEAVGHQAGPAEATALLYRFDGQVVLTQLICIPNLAKYHGLPLDSNSLHLDFLEKLAFEQLGEALPDVERRPFQPPARSVSTGVHDFVQGLKESSYHLMRFGCLSAPFNPTVNKNVNV